MYRIYNTIVVCVTGTAAASGKRCTAAEKYPYLTSEDIFLHRILMSSKTGLKIM